MRRRHTSRCVSVLVEITGGPSATPARAGRLATVSSRFVPPAITVRNLMLAHAGLVLFRASHFDFRHDDKTATRAPDRAAEDVLLRLRIRGAEGAANRFDLREG